jgi:lysophospholipase L1-like esterase
MRILSSITRCGVLVAVAGCGATPVQPDPPPAALELSCPAPIVREAASPNGRDVFFDVDAPAGGRAPVTVECAPASGSVFEIGETIVRCTATDTAMTQASCEFPVTVRVSQTLAKTKFTAFGDSITDGKVSLVPLVSLAGPDTYPYKLEQMLRERYPSQLFVVSNQGHSGEHTRDGAARIAAVLDEEKPEVVLLLEGINNINGFSTATQAAALRTMIVEAQRRGVDVIIATLMPVLPTSHIYKPGITSSRIEALNTEIFSLAAQYNLGSPVNLFAIFQAEPGLIGIDGLHPTIQGQTRIAEAFRDEIVRRYDVRSTSTSSLRFSTMRRIDGP